MIQSFISINYYCIGADLLDLYIVNVTIPRLAVFKVYCWIFSAHARHSTVIFCSNGNEVNCTNTNGWTCSWELLIKYIID